MGGLAIRPRWVRGCARIPAIPAAFSREFDLKLLLKQNGPAVLLPAAVARLSRSRPRAKKKGAQTTALARGGGRDMSIGARGVLQAALMGLILRPWDSKISRNGPRTRFRAGTYRRRPRQRPHGFFSARLSIPMVALVIVGEGRWVRGGSRGCNGRSFHYARLLGADRGNAARERPRVSALSEAAYRDARALSTHPTHPTTRPSSYLDVPSLLERTARARCRLFVHVEKPRVLSEARR